ncbi:glutaredoxin-like YruB-family protein [Cytobacillus horneckiae]|uniref:Glutaredoxin family protein n=1 Tax=Cytobacillus horneckiae TaxID=549687 RepID=A0A2N0Z8Y8_9BACI|nr:glutaredoxin family protein [Cytobacillus horneckiae]MBN6889226.1 glutaredoxin family protein [Cytobacillus horneckiae]MCM3178446.1 glutaredoxin family protein [Cytobacillus horneckiae]MEC1156816.1 glutaredoxin family protein [Cytobacillus horneckiae]MED2940576.1 glutaredoxin family protein [Cytobacillus horneckiae]PKG25972.1 glutaredoxin family protein [Cytobacillus horneckiae]
MKPIVVYTQPDCPPCEITKKFLSEYNFEFEQKNIKTDKSAMKELTEKYQSFSTPTIVIGEEVITGFDLERLKAVLEIK